MNHTITKNGNDFTVDPKLHEARKAALEDMQKHDIDYEPKKLKFPMLKGKKDERS